jgi:hypothetical protein
VARIRDSDVFAAGALWAKPVEQILTAPRHVAHSLGLIEFTTGVRLDSFGGNEILAGPASESDANLFGMEPEIG